MSRILQRPLTSAAVVSNIAYKALRGCFNYKYPLNCRAKALHFRALLDGGEFEDVGKFLKGWKVDARYPDVTLFDGRMAKVNAKQARAEDALRWLL
jgi:hypothetical protein